MNLNLALIQIIWIYNELNKLNVKSRFNFMEFSVTDV